jgi:hypothetical protein
MSTVSWINDPVHFVSDFSFRTFGKFPTSVITQLTLSPTVFEHKVVIDDAAGIFGSGLGKTKDEAEKAAYFSLCQKISSTSGSATLKDIQNMPEYEQYLSKDAPESKSYHWYHTAKLEASKIALKLTGKEPIYLTSVADLDQNIYLCQLVVDEDKGLVGYGRSANSKDATRLAAVDFCLRHKTTKPVEKTLGINFDDNIHSFCKNLPELL